MTQSKFLFYEIERKRFEDLIKSTLAKTRDLLGYEVDIAEANYLYYTSAFAQPRNKYSLRAIIDTVETYYWYLNWLKKDLYKNK
jgi:hypothetical protein